MIMILCCCECGLFLLIGLEGEEHDVGGPGLCVEMLLMWLEFRVEKLLFVLMMVDSNRLDVKFGIPQFVQCHGMLFSAIYTGVDICMQSA